MNPSTSSNVEVATFKVSTRQLAPDLGSVGAEYNARDLGALSTAPLTELLDKLLAIPSDKLLDADPHLVVTGRRGRFLVRPGRGKLRLNDAADPNRAFLELSSTDAPEYLDGLEIKASAAAENLTETVDVNDTRLGLVIGLMAFSAAILVGSAYFTFKTDSIDPDSEYTAVAPDQMSGLRRQFTGVFTTGKADNSRVLTIRPEGTLTLVEYGPGSAVADRREDTYKFALHNGKSAARAARLGPIEVRDSKSVTYAGETYTRQP